MDLTWVKPKVSCGLRYKLDLEKGRTRDQIDNTRWIIEKARQFQKNIYFCFIDYTKSFDCVDHNKLWKILKEMDIPDHLICLLRNLYVGQEAIVRLRHEQLTGSWSSLLVQCRKEYDKAVYCHSTYLNLCRVHHEKRWTG